jgi:hypothetical protein
MDIFNEQSAVLVKKLENELDKDSFNIFPYVTLCTLDIVCGTEYFFSFYSTAHDIESLVERFIIFYF